MGYKGRSPDEAQRLLGTLIALLLSTTPVAAQPIGYDELLERVEATSPLMAAARSGLEHFEHTLGRADWAYFPTFRLDAGVAPVPSITEDGTSGDISVDWSSWGYFYRVSLTMVQPVYTFGKIAGLSEAAERGLDVGQAQVEVARWDLRERAAQAYHGALLSRELSALFLEGKGWLDKAEAKMAKSRDADDDDYDQLAHLRLKSRVADFWQMEADNKALHTASHEGLRLLLSYPPGKPVRPREDSLTPTPVRVPSIGECLAFAERSTPGLKLARAGAAAKAALADAAESAVWPDLMVLGEVSATDSNAIEADGSVPGSRNLGLAAGLLLGVRWDLDVAQKLHEGRATRAAADQLAHKARAARDLMEVEVRRLHQQLTDTVRLVEVTRKSMVAARGWLTASWDLYDTGFGAFKDVMDALVQFYGKKVGYLKTVHEHNLLVVRLSRAIGQDLTRVSTPTE